MKVQVTLFSKKGYKPVSTLVEMPIKEWLENKGANYKSKALGKICNKRLWTKKDLFKYGYTQIKMRVYDQEKIKEDAEKRYEEIKRERGWA
jgi:hypothetical protein